jgi:hypothetical protein
LEDSFGGDSTHHAKFSALAAEGAVFFKYLHFVIGEKDRRCFTFINTYSALNTGLSIYLDCHSIPPAPPSKKAPSAIILAGAFSLSSSRRATHLSLEMGKYCLRFSNSPSAEKTVSDLAFIAPHSVIARGKIGGVFSHPPLTILADND